MRTLGTRGKRVRGIQRDQSVSSGIQRPAAAEPIIGSALAIDGVPLSTHWLNSSWCWCHYVGIVTIARLLQKVIFVVFDAE